ncbi:hypothetical protein LR48_Vigan11g132800 [Vigna angularis]|uniref:Glycosyltransferase family 28 N-terminal domain-containing protein n=1 Tax=Phaseolus angularis TaxID=3914 RepID=A0A0L9VU46_PHAAN|nr:hypothetical protein LR48_Vigan11g132800 [Vigna angularis]
MRGNGRSHGGRERKPKNPKRSDQRSKVIYPERGSQGESSDVIGTRDDNSHEAMHGWKKLLDMVKNKGFLPSGPSEIPIQRNQMKEIINSLLPACKEPDIDSGVPFKADAIIANPPAYGHTHVAEALKIPIHIFFTMPWTPTTEFPHPLSRVKQQAGYRLSYQIVDSLIWLGIRDMINDLRKKKLKLRPVTYLSGSQGSETEIPHAYIWSPHLVPKPKDWGPKIDVVGFCFLDLASNYEPPESLVKWLGDGDKPIYIGFGSLPVQEPKKMTEIIVDALETTGQRGIINKGWGGLGNCKNISIFCFLDGIVLVLRFFQHVFLPSDRTKGLNILIG